MASKVNSGCFLLYQAFFAVDVLILLHSLQTHIARRTEGSRCPSRKGLNVQTRSCEYIFLFYTTKQHFNLKQRSREKRLVNAPYSSLRTPYLCKSYPLVALKDAERYNLTC